MPIDRKSAAKVREAAHKQAYAAAPRLVKFIVASDPLFRTALAADYLIDAYMRGYERRKREDRNGK